ncbi:hypothetical protein AOQ84DRAFT_357217 [Glonium stellatum]|uniref:Kinetochore protein mis14 n=1 Tax=Glonium stellatum TaxID=574774 RepID=A0A8E2EQK4_9PEZI|nr:hypothetical protein AOQ84DRAFT_357217 [Glonium stellatum]
MDSNHHRRVELQSPADFTFLEGNVKQAARQKIDLHLPPSAAPVGEDELRKKVEELVDEYIRNTFAAAKQNISINGMDTEEVEKQAVGEEFEPFDSRLKDRLEALTVQKNSLVEKVADLRRTAPTLAAQAYQTAFLQESDQWEQEYRMREAQALQAPERVLDLDELKRWDEVQRMWERGTEGLGMLKGGLPETRARLERAEGVVGYLEGK